MKRTRIAAALAALASTGALAVSGDAWYGTNRVYAEGVAPIEVTRVDVDRPLIYEERVVGAPVYVEREYVVVPDRDYVVVERDYYAYDGEPLFYTTPNAQHELRRNLFDRKGPNDFGA